MCGIAGINNFDKSVVGYHEIQAMIRQLEHRGPDDSGIFCDQYTGLGSTRLSIFDLSPAGHMPMVDEETGNRIVHNGEVYNFRELRHSLRLTNLKSNTDTEVILKAYGKLGTDCLSHFNGIYAFAIWDENEKKLFCARDPLGVKPFFYWKNDVKISFSSEIKALFTTGAPRTPNFPVIHDYLTKGLYEHGRETFFKDIYQLEPGKFLTVKNGRTEIKKYWDLETTNEDTTFYGAFDKNNIENLVEEFRSILEDSIRLQLLSDTRIATHVSGGLDSALLLTIINKLQGGQNRILALTQVYDEEKYDEWPYVSTLSKELGWRAQRRILKVEDVPYLAKKAMWHQEQPFPGVVTLAKQHLIKSSVDLGAKVILEGQGGDEIAAGYRYYFGAFILDLLQKGEVERANSEIRYFGKINGISTEQAQSIANYGIASYFQPGRSADGTNFVNNQVLDQDFLLSEKKMPRFRKPFKSNLLNMQYRDIFHTKLPRILRSCDRASMAYGRELRVPFLDHRLVEFTFSLPAEAKIYHGIQRYFKRMLLNKSVSSNIANISKRLIVDPQMDWLKGPLKQFVLDTVHTKKSDTRGFFNPKKIKQAYLKFLDDEQSENSFQYWQWLSMEIWFQEFIDKDPCLPNPIEHSN